MPKTSAYAQRLNDRMKAKRAATRAAADTPEGAPTVAATSFPAEAGYVHPRRYPKHDDLRKGQVMGGVCNVTLCNNTGAIFFNRGTYGLYCETCARSINRDDPAPLCVPVSEKPGAKRMDEMEKEMFAQMRAHRASA